jgi:PKD repeat protein
MRHSLFLLTFFLFQSFSAIAQKHKVDSNSYNHRFCAADHFHDQRMQTDKTYALRYEKSRRAMKKAQNTSYRLASGVYQVPVVVHIMHKGESVGEGTNISDEEVKDGIRYLNNFWRKVSKSNGDGNGVDMEVEFVLAVQDENGNCTNGIVRKDMSAVMPYVNFGVNADNSDGIPDHDDDLEINSLKEYSHWDPTKYYNIWLVDEIDNSDCSSNYFTAGYAYYASSHGKDSDGSVVLFCSFTDESDVTLAHEIGHAFNLPHTFDGDDDADDGTYQCGDDGIDDTPKHIRTMFIDDLYEDCDNTDENSCDPNFNLQMSPTHKGNGTHQDHVLNYMDYSGCASEFTYGQRVVVKSTLINERASFLGENGNKSLLPSATPQAGFSASSSVVCIGSSVRFTDQSTCIPNSYTNETIDGLSFKWIFDNGLNTPIQSTDQNPEIIFNHSGAYHLTLEVTNSFGTSRLSQPNFILVSELLESACSSSSFNHSDDYGLGVVNVDLNTLDHFISTFIPESSMQDFSCSQNTILAKGVVYNLSATYMADQNDDQFLEIWIDWDNNGTFELVNSNEINELILSDQISKGKEGLASIDFIVPDESFVNRLLRMRVISNSSASPEVCGKQVAQRADDYGVFVREVIKGCMNEVACNYNEAAIEDDGSYIVPTSCDLCDAGQIKIDASLDGVCESCQDGVIISNDADVDDVCDADEVAGCKDEKACNYDLRSTTDRDDSLCIYPTEVYLDCSGACLNDADADGVCDEEMGVYEFDDLGLLVYPNPADEILYLMSEFAHEMIHVELMTITGRSISARELINIEGNTVVDLIVGHLSTGLYLLKVSNDKQSNIVPWIKK